MSETPEPPENLMQSLQSAQFEWPANSNQWIIPIGSLDTLIKLDTVTEELCRISASSPLDKDDLQRYATEICASRKRLFALLLFRWAESKCCQAIRDLVDENVDDSHLPFERIHIPISAASNRHPRRPYKLCIKGHAKCAESNCTCAVKALKRWNQREIEDFSRDQWMVLSPVFQRNKDQIPHHDWDDNIRMPFKEDYERTELLTGGYSEVWPVRVHIDHQKIYKSLKSHDKEPKLAIKRLFSPLVSDFENEKEMLTALQKRPHKHLVELLATYKYKGKYHLLFPYADANLRAFWKRIPNPEPDSAPQLWALDQMTGLASGLAAIHNYQSNMAFNKELGYQGATRFRDSIGRYIMMESGEEKFGRHGDLKAENILWFNDINVSGPSGILQITDFGLGHFHRLESRSRQNAREIKGSDTYVPPEIPLNQLVSRSYDIWSLGCLFLEFATWLVEGYHGLEVFEEQRLARAPDGVRDDTFYTLISGGAELRSGVRTWIKHLHNSPYCSKMVQELLKLLQDKLLVVEPKSRISAEELYLKLKQMLQKSKDSSEYLTVGNNDQEVEG